MGIPSLRRFTLFGVLLIFVSSLRHHSSLVGSEDPEFEGYRAGIISDSGELEISIPTAPALEINNLPSKSDLSSQLPLPYPQGNQASSVGFALGYALKSYTENRKLPKPKNLSKLSVSNPDNQNIFFSPSFIYNSTNQGKDLGGSLLDGLILLATKGIATWSEMPYKLNDYRSQPNPSLTTNLQYKIHDFRRFQVSDLAMMKAYINNGHPLPASLLFYEGYTKARDRDILNKLDGKFIGGQVVLICGYDDSKKAFKFWNSWGPDWGDDGYGWISYSHFQKTAKAVFWVDDSPNLRSPIEIAKSYPMEIVATRGNYKDRVRISWTSVNNAIGYEIYRKRTSESKFQLVGLSVNQNFEDFGVQKNLAYNYSVSSVFADESSALSQEWVEGYASEKILPSHTQEITGLTATHGNFNDRILIQWDPIPGVKSYHLYKFNRYSQEFRLLSKTNKPEHIDRRAERNGNLEFYRVSVEGPYAKSQLSPAKFGYTSSRSMSLPPPHEVEASKGDHIDRITVNWAPVNGAAEYKVFRMSSKSGKTWEEIASTVNNIYDDISPSSPSNYYSVASQNKLGTWNRGSTPVLGTLAQSTERNTGLKPPSAVEIRELKTLNSNELLLRLSWKVIKDAKSYYIYKRSVATSWVKLGESKSSYYQFPLKLNDKFTQYAVSSVNEYGIEGRKSKRITFAKMEPIVDEVTTRAFGAESNLEKFKGPWTSLYWDGKANVINVTLKIDSKDETNETCEIQFNQKVIYEGDYIQEAKIVDPNGSFQIEISNSGEALMMEIKDKKVFKEKTVLSFLRE
ncbi:C1 family peptidase [Leptospira sp. GIMC2001]|uniref:C1 family peptidase n=1 Tax=Leptospira sp. GIMC2001 TaxID=1513297 RepID=UPI00234B1807|nr:C1 family peptidase [Leptospira sp. GIMC2001]WCL47697.1 hypothetical protein O4O04_00130 [Leptospira sp. GIMC2001]